MAKKKSSLSSTFMDVVVVGMVVLMSVGANLPEDMSVAMDRRYLVAGLIGIIAISLIRYLKFTLVLVVVILAVGANLPAQIANELGVNSNVLMFALVSMIVVSALNGVFKMPTGLDAKTTASQGHGAAALYNAISKGRIASVKQILKQGVNPNVRTKEGYTPLMFAASKGFNDVVQLLIDSGADLHAKDKSGKSALDVANEKDFESVANLLSNAVMSDSSGQTSATA